MSGKGIAAAFTLITNVVMLAILSLSLKILPNSPFQNVLSLYPDLSVLNEYMQYVLYFLPIPEIIAVMELWVACILPYFMWEFFFKISTNVGSFVGGIKP